MQQPMQNLEDISDPTTALDMALELMSKAFQLNNTTTTNNNQRSSSNPCYSQIAQSGMNMDQDRQMQMVDDNVVNYVVSGIANQHGNGNVVTTWTEGNSNEINGNQIRCYNCRGDGHYASNYTVKPRNMDAAYLQTQLQIAQKDETEIQLNYEEFDFMDVAGAYDNIGKMDKLSMEQSGRIVEQHPANVEETHVLYDSLYNNLAIEVERN
ncbi:hypothetical protein Tco_0248258 [Tanacetum coccineum]